MFAELLPSNVTLVIADDSMWEMPLSDAEEQTVLKAVEKRKREFRCGRNAAKLALQNAGAGRNLLLLPEPESRRPIWPQGFVGSITHTAGFCAAAVAQQQDYLAIGIDAELKTPLKQELVSHICTEREQQWIKDRPCDSHQPCLGKIIFCIKETLYKVFNPVHKVFLGFNEAEVTLEPGKGRFSAYVWRRKEGIRCHYQGRFAMDDNFIYASTLQEQGAHR